MPTEEMPQHHNDRLGNYLRAHRKRAGLSLLELAQLLGYGSEGSVLRHETSQTIPPLLVSLGYEVVFRVPLKDLLPGIQETVERTMEARLLRFEEEIQKKGGKGTHGRINAQKLAWLDERRTVLEN